MGLTFLVFAGLGITDGAVGVPDELTPPIAIIIALLGFIWCRTDAAQHGDRPGAGLLLLVILLVPAGLGTYLLSRGRIGTFLKGIGIAVALLGIAAASFALAHRMRYGAWPDFAS